MNNLLKPLKVIAFNGSPHKQGNTFHLIQRMFEKFQKHKVETELIQIGSQKIQGCNGCKVCSEKKNYKCIIEKDSVNEYIDKIRKADGVILGTPVYFSGPTGILKNFIDRFGYVSRNNKESHGHRLLWHKVCAGISVHGRGGAANTLSQLNYLFTINSAIIPGSIYWNFGVGSGNGDVMKDESGLKNMDDLANEMFLLMKMVRQDQKINQK
ncbi:nad(p)h-dependent fmn-containing oxidoreductase ywqn-related [Anaeramoeba flamelloides]|uniref:Nad(P)h-dependent fmn-containing oxidoreductase ywqn-related n=1 Tax=Anaeramoeba flamelloides TaxID=1746091 RepID=A0AAV7Y1N8_9EUKA|nr:nad(p)h-dependent fmn-containing oxidoreductase ywqn-related [Anaeramoeba flamelloides]